jgi:hypothetical protein
MTKRSELKRLRKLAGILKESTLNEEMAQAWRKNGRWTDGTYTEGDAITWRGLGWNLEWEPDPQGLANNRDTGQPVEGAWFAVNDDGEEIEFEPGMEDRHDPQFSAKPAFPESTGRPVVEAPYNTGSDEAVLEKMMNEMRKMVDRIEFLSRQGGSLEKRINAIGGDPSYVADLLAVAGDLQRAIDEVDYGARAHLSQE